MLAERLRGLTQNVIFLQGLLPGHTLRRGGENIALTPSGARRLQGLEVL